ncbi:MAG: hypothetical protein MI747_08655 [Desulfobacterales bacterium]|nr:hypothetical protein [Desulfobacterales bacterium]
MFTKLGFLSLFAGGFMGVFTLISTFMEADNIWVDITLDSLLTGRANDFIDSFSNPMLQDKLNYVVHHAPLSIVVMCLGGIFIIVGMFRKV